MGMDGKTIRLRASCNACNESKVRCSQRKPTCARCERNGVECVYGLSRRTHKDAPPISMPPSQRTRGPSRTSSNNDIHGSISGHKSHNSNNSNTSWSGLSFAKSASATPATSTPNGGASPERGMSTGMSTHDTNTALFGDYLSQLQPYTPQTPTTADPTHRAGMPLDFSRLPGVAGSSSSGPHIDPLSAAVTQFSTPVAEYANPWAMGSLFGSSSTNNNTHTNTIASNSNTSDSGPSAADMSAFMATPPSPPSLGDYTCNCHAGVTELLTSMRGGGDDRRLPIDAQLAKLKRCIASSESSMACTHGRDDGEPIHIMAVATLIGYVIDEFEMLACDLVAPALRKMSPSAGDSMAAALAGTGGERAGGGSSLSSGSDESMSMVSAGGSMSLANFMEPKLSWGMLELEDDDEVDLRQRLYLLSFRKLERLLSQLTMYLRNLHDARASLSDPSRHMAFVMACDYTRLWLEKKAEDVKRLLSASVGDEILDPSLV
uniref:Zn(II)2Cys6 transcription factor n=1 Tax=Gnomonia sp. TaxID=2011790 RepID=A0AAU8CJA1_9PEZI